MSKFYIYNVMVKEKSVSKKRKSKGKLSSVNVPIQNGVNVPIVNSSILTDNPCAIAQTKKRKHLNLSKSESIEYLKDCEPSMTASTSKLNVSKYEPFYIPNNVNMGGISNPDMNANINMPVSQYYFLTKLMHQHKKVLEPDSINVKRNETLTSNNVTSTTTNTSPCNIISTRNGTKKIMNTDPNNMDFKNNNISNVDDPFCQCHLLLDPYPSQLSLRSAPNLQHYCRVCNTQLNSCKQAQIHTEGKKHEKRLAYLKFSLETGLQNETLDQQIYQPTLEFRNFPSDGTILEVIQPVNQSVASKSSTTVDSELIKKVKDPSKLRPKSTPVSGICNTMSKTNGSSLTPINQQMQTTSTGTTTATVQSDGTTQFIPSLIPPIPPPPMLPPALAAAAASAAVGGSAQPFFPSFVQFPASHSGPYYFQQHSSSNPALPIPSSSNYDMSVASHSKTSSPNDYHPGYLGTIYTSSASGGISDNSTSNATILQQVSSTPSSTQPEVTNINPQHAPVLSPQMLSSIFPQTMMSIPPVPSNSMSSLNCNINDTINNNLNTNTPVASYHINQQINTSMPFQETNQSFSIDSNHGLPLKNHLSTSYNSSTICQTSNAIEAPFYNTEGEDIYPYSDHSGQPSFIKNRKEGPYKSTMYSGNIKPQKDKRGISALYKINTKKHSSGLIGKHNRNGLNKNICEPETSRFTENSDGYISSVSQSSARLSTQRRSLSSTNGSTKIFKGNFMKQPLPLYNQKQVPVKQKQSKCQSLDRSSDSDFTSQLSGSSKNKDTTSATCGNDMTTCDLCKLTFPSQSVLDNHLKGSRHTRRVKSQQAFRQLQDNGTNLRQSIIHEDGTIEDGLHFGEICCEVCEVSVNSSHQLQAHLAGHKHKVRCFRRGLHPSTAVLTPTRLVPSSSTPPSTAPSECSSTMPRSATSFKYNPLSTSHYDTGTTTSSNNSYCLSNGTKSEGSRGGKKASNNKTSLLGEPPPLHSSLLHNSHVLNSTPIPFNANQGDGLLPLPDNIKPLGVHTNAMGNPCCLFTETKLFTNNKNTHSNIAQGTPQNIISQTNKYKSSKKVTRPSRNNSNTVRRYSTTESDDQTDLTKIKSLLPTPDKIKKDLTSSPNPANTIADLNLTSYSKSMKINPVSHETHTSSSSAYDNDPDTPFQILLPQPNLRGSKLINVAAKEEIVCDNDETNNQSNECNSSFVSSIDEAKESSEDDSDRISHIISCTMPISCNRKTLEGGDGILSDTSIPGKSNTSSTTEVSKSSTTKQHTIIPGLNGSKTLLSSSNVKILTKTSPNYCCEMCNVIVNSAAQLTQHMNSPRHHVKVTDCKTKAEQQKKEEQQKQQPDNSKLKEIPMLNMFLKTLQPPPILPPSPLQNSALNCNSSGNSQYFSSDKEGEGDSSSNTEVER